MQADVSMVWVVVNTVLAMVGLFGVAGGLNGYMFGSLNPVFRTVLVVFGVCAMIPLTGFADTTYLMLNVAGLAVLVVICVFQILRNKGKKNGSTPEDGNPTAPLEAAA